MLQQTNSRPMHLPFKRNELGKYYDILYVVCIQDRDLVGKMWYRIKLSHRQKMSKHTNFEESRTCNHSTYLLCTRPRRDWIANLCGNIHKKEEPYVYIGVLLDSGGIKIETLTTNCFTSVHFYLETLSVHSIWQLRQDRLLNLQKHFQQE